MTKTWALATMSVCLICIGGDLHAAELRAPIIGAHMVWDCDGPFTRRYDLEVVGIQDNVVRYEGKIDSGIYFAEKHAHLTGTSLWYKLVGERRQWFDLEDFEDYRSMTPGSRFKGAVPAVRGDDKWVWRYDVSIGQPRSVSHPVLGTVELVPISEKRSVFHGTYWSEMTTYLLPEKGLSVSWVYVDANGKETCELVQYSG